MAATWSAGSSWLEYTTADFAGDGAFTFAVLTAPSAANAGLFEWLDSAVAQGCALFFGNKVFGRNDSSSGYGSFPSNGTWYLIAVTKAAGAAHYRMHAWTYASDGSGTMSHGESVSAANHSDFSGADVIRLGTADGLDGAGLIAATAIWDRALSDAELDTLVSASLNDWALLEPDFGVELSDWDGATGDNVFAGTSTFAEVAGTVASGTNPTGFDFTVDEPPVDPPDEDPTEGELMLTTARGTVTTTLVSIQDYLGLDDGYPGGDVVIENTGATTVYLTEGAIGSTKGFAIATTKGITLHLHTLDDVFLVTATGSSAVQVACSQKP